MIKLSQNELNLLEIYSIYNIYQIKPIFYEWSAAYALHNKGRLSIEPAQPAQRIGVTQHLHYRKWLQQKVLSGHGEYILYSLKKSRVFLCGETDETTKKGF